MLTIEHCDVVEEIAIGDLFSEIGFERSSASTDESGDSFVRNEWSIEVLSLDSYYPVEGFRWTKLEKQIRIHHTDVDGADGKYIQCSPEHLVMCLRGGKPDWLYARDLVSGDVLVSRAGYRKFDFLEGLVEEDRLCDMQVSIAHSYYVEDILSHNSHFLVQMGANAMRAGKNVLHYTYELRDTLVAMRYDSNFTGISFNDLHDSKDAVAAHYAGPEGVGLGRLVVKEYPPHACSIQTMRAHVERLALNGFVPDMIIVDYADIMRSSRQYDSLRHELKLIYEELRGYASEINVPIWTASQSNRDAAQADVVGLESMSEAYGKAFVADIIVSISRKAEEKSTGWCRLHIAKNRAGRDGLVYNMKIDTERSKFSVAGGRMTPAQVDAEVEAAAKRSIREKLRELDGDERLALARMNERQSTSL